MGGARRPELVLTKQVYEKGSISMDLLVTDSEENESDILLEKSVCKALVEMYPNKL